MIGYLFLGNQHPFLIKESLIAIWQAFEGYISIGTGVLCTFCIQTTDISSANNEYTAPGTLGTPEPGARGLYPRHFFAAMLC